MNGVKVVVQWWPIMVFVSLYIELKVKHIILVISRKTCQANAFGRLNNASVGRVT